MKTAIAALLLSGTALTPALAQDCTSPTRCTELGYTMSKDDCDGIKSLVFWSVLLTAANTFAWRPEILRPDQLQE